MAQPSAVVAAAGVVANEKVVLGGRFLRVTFGASAADTRGELRDHAGRVVLSQPAIALAGTFTCAFDLARVPPGDGYAAFLVSGNRAQQVGQGVGRQSGVAVGAEIASSTFDVQGEDRRAILTVEPGTRALALRIAAVAAAIPSRPVDIRYSVIAPIYNVASYLDDFFSSLVGQTIGFREHIEIIAVDDGSTDKSADIVVRWQAAFPDNIRILRKANGGLSSARNAGVPLVRGRWVAFLDPDDFVSPSYFAAADVAIDGRDGAEIAMVACNVHYFIESESAKRDEHPLRDRFAKGARTVSVNDLGQDMQAMVANALFSAERLRSSRIVFDEALRFGFEDAHFLGRLLLRAGDDKVVFVPDAIYFYRRRADQSSITDGLMGRRAYYLARMRFGHLGLLRDVADFGPVPHHIQTMALYNLAWLVRHVLTAGAKVEALLGKDGRREHLEILSEIFAFIEPEVIADHDLAGVPFLYPVGLLNMFKNADPPFQVVEVTRWDEVAGRVTVRSWSRQSGVRPSFTVDGIAAVPSATSETPLTYLRLPFAFETVSTVPLPTAGTLSAYFDGVEARVAVGSRRHAGGISLAAIRDGLREKPPGL